jgi:hypothetical protein
MVGEQWIAWSSAIIDGIEQTPNPIRDPPE